MNNRAFATPCLLILLLTYAWGQTSPGGILIPGQPISGDRKELVSINGIPALKFVTKDGWSSIVYFQKYEGLDAFSIPVWHIDGLGRHRGWLYISEQRVRYVPDGEKSAAFDVPRNKIKKAKSVSTGAWNIKNRGNYLELAFNNGSQEFWIYFSGSPEIASRLGLGGTFQKPVLSFIERMFADFDKATQEFQELTIGLKPKSAPPNFGIIDSPLAFEEKYDRFKDRTTLGTSTMLIRNLPGENFSLSISAMVSFPGLKASRPDSVTLKFSASSLRRFFVNEKEREVTFLVDGERCRLGSLSVDSQEIAATNVPLANLQNEIFKTEGNVVITMDLFEKIARASKVELQVGDIEGELRGEHLRVFQSLVSRVHPILSEALPTLYPLVSHKA